LPVGRSTYAGRVCNALWCLRLIPARGGPFRWLRETRVANVLPCVLLVGGMSDFAVLHQFKSTAMGCLYTHGVVPQWRLGLGRLPISRCAA
jgi:hypothetical protein